MSRVYNFAAGPAMLPETVLRRFQTEMLDWQGTGVSIAEIGHRTPEFTQLLERVIIKIKQQYNVPDNYKIIFLAGGAQACFSLIPMNICQPNDPVDYLVTGIWSERAAAYAKRYVSVNIINSPQQYGIVDGKTWNRNPNAKYLYYCDNETINGIAISPPPIADNIPLIVDMTSSIFSETVDITKFGIIFASAQKNLGIAGITLLIIRNDLMNKAMPIVPEIFNFTNQFKNNSVLNTIPTVPIYVLDLMLDWIKEQGGVETLAKLKLIKANKLYHYIDHSEFYINHVESKYRSLSNIPFSIQRDDLHALFLDEADACGLKYLKGHKLVGGMRASLYNAMPEIAIDKLINFMQEFKNKYS